MSHFLADNDNNNDYDNDRNNRDNNNHSNSDSTFESNRDKDNDDNLFFQFNGKELTLLQKLFNLENGISSDGNKKYLGAHHNVSHDGYDQYGPNRIYMIYMFSIKKKMVRLKPIYTIGKTGIRKVMMMKNTNFRILNHMKKS